MKNSTKPLSIITTLVLAVLFLPFSSVLALGQITQPIEIEDAQRGSSYEESVTVVNTDNTTTFIILSGEDDIKNWVEFYEIGDDSKKINLIEIGPKKNKTVVARFTIPEETPNGTYTGFISAKTNPDQGKTSEEESSSTLSQRIDREVTIEVGGEENIDFKISLIPDKFDYETGDSLKIRIMYENLGNVEITPDINFKIKDAGETVYNAIFPFPESEDPIKPGSVTETSPLEIPTTSLRNGKFTASFEVSDGETVVEKDFTFSLGLVKAETSQNIVNFQSGLNGKDILYAAIILAIIILFHKPIIGIFKKKKTEEKDSKKENKENNIKNKN